ncbi:MAG: cytochrome c biogenesis protein [Cyclobacteriaceae bacterium]|nr:cytochrome c biogenesis protein [Cyclobacteriaceae bacterium]
MRTNWWKWVVMILLVYTIVAGLVMAVPRLPILNETIRNLHFHVPMWFGMIFLFGGSVFHAIRYLGTKNLKYDAYSKALMDTGLLYGVLGITTGMLWASFTWGEPWSNDPKQNASAVALLIYFALMVLRGSLNDDQQRARIAAVYNIFAFAVLVPLLFILPRLTDSLHPGNGGNPGFNAYDLDNNLRLVFYPAVIGWTMLGFWIATLKSRYLLLEIKRDA